MTRADTFDLLLLAALWGGSFLFMRLGAHEFGPLPLAFVRVAGASLLLLPWLAWRGEAAALRQHWLPLTLVGWVNSALPFWLFALASLALTTGLMAVFNATSPLWAAVIGVVWLRQRLTAAQGLGLALGFAGVVALSWGKADLQPGALGISPALGIAACIVATVSYGLAAHLSRRQLAAVPPMAVAAGSQLASAAVLAVPAWWAWPGTAPSGRAWAAAALLALVCTGFAYTLYFRLISRVGPTRAISVTFLIPAFAMLWGALFLGEWPTGGMLAGSAVILLGTGLSTGLLKRPARAA